MSNIMPKEPLLFLCHRIPFPPNKGDKITTFNLLKYLSERYLVHLGCFIDDEYDRQYINELAQFCESSFCEDICNRKQSTSGVKALLTSEAVSTAHYRSTKFQQWVDSTITENDIDLLFVYSSGMSQFIECEQYQHKTRILDMADIDSDKWRQYAENKPWYSRWIYSREQKILAKHEQQILQDFEAVTFITDEEAALFRTMSPSSNQEKIYTLSNGVDTNYFDPQSEFDLTDLPPLASPAICFTGAMDYWANVDAVIWFCKNVWPEVIAKVPTCTFYIVGGKPPAKVMQLKALQGIIVAGRVPDVRPYLAASTLAIAPMRIARGVQNKVLEAMAMAMPVVMTSMGQEGIQVDAAQKALVHDEPLVMAKSIIRLLEQKTIDYSENRQWIIKHYSWNGALDKLPSLLALKNDKKKELS
jgi:sugar transferase (PEP-CTERM/EpsH1 system associated)